MNFSSSNATSFSPSYLYKQTFVQGFTIKIHPDLASHPIEAAQLYIELEKQLRSITEVVPVNALYYLQQVTIWVEWQNDLNGAAVYHPSKQWLEINGFNVDKTDSVEINNTKNFIGWSDTQPWMMLHELAHAYHFQILGEMNLKVLEAYRQAVEKKLYDSVEYDGRHKMKAYAMNNAKEYFAELTEAYFGRNDFYPYTHEDLREHDILGYWMMESSWGLINASPSI